MSSFLSIFEISASGMSAEHLRLQASTMNIANASSVRSPEGFVYQPVRVVTQTAATKSFQSHLDARHAEMLGVSAELVPVENSTRSVYDPDHPFADERGFVQQVAVDHVFEMTQVMQAVRAYEANIKAFGAARSMMQLALRIGEQS